jgi:hypothetical protein
MASLTAIAIWRCGSRGLNPGIAMASWPSAAKSSITLPPGYLDSDYVREDGVSPARVVTRAEHCGSLAAAKWIEQRGKINDNYAY